MRKLRAGIVGCGGIANGKHLPAMQKSGLYEDGVRKDRLDNSDMIDQLEARIRAKATMMDEAQRISVQQVEK